MAWKRGDEVYDRDSDIFGTVVQDEQDGKVTVKRDWPWDPKAPPEETLGLHLEDAAEVRKRYDA